MNPISGGFVKASLSKLTMNWNITLSRRLNKIVLNLLKQLLTSIGISLIRSQKLDALYESLDRANAKTKWMHEPSKESLQYFVQSQSGIPESKSQLQQDLVAAFIQSMFSEHPGFFVEFGATDGKSYSNTYSLEKKFRWSGILAEPAKTWHRDLSINRGCVIDHRCVWSSSGVNLLFNEASEAEYSTVNSFSDSDLHTEIRKKGRSYFVQTIDLQTLLNEHNAPKEISYLSIDTEGSELEILRAFNFDEYKFNFISVEHNYSDQRHQLHDLLVKNGYQRVLVNMSEWDDWYVRRCQETIGFLETINA